MFNVKSEETVANMYAAGDTDFTNCASESSTYAAVSSVAAPATPSNNATNQADADAQLFSTLCEIDKHNYLYLFERCRVFNVNARQLRFLEKDHIRRIIPPDQIGILAEFEYLHYEWKKTKFSILPTLPVTTTTTAAATGANTIPTTSAIATVTLPSRPIVIPSSVSIPKILQATSISAAVSDMTETNALETSKTLTTAKISSDKRRNKRQRSDSSPSSEDELTNNIINCRGHAFPLDKIIKREMKKVRAQYKKNGFLVERDRRLLASALVDYFRSRSIYMSRDIMESLAVQISEVFPTESKNAWHDMSKHHRRRGRLCLKLYNVQRTKRATACYRKNLRDSHSGAAGESDETTQEEAVQQENDNERHDNERIQIWLKENKCEDNDELVQMWYESSNYRTKLLRRYNTEEFGSTGKHIEELLANWPAYTYEMGNVLISIDFNHIHPNSESTFYERWPIFMLKVVKLCRAEIKDSICADLFNQYERLQDTFSDDTKHYILLHLFHAIMRPTRPIHARQSARRFSILESQAGFSQLIEDASEMDSYCKPFPCIFIVGTQFNVQSCYVAFKDMRFELNFIDAFYTCFQIFTIFKLHFPLAAMNFWTFVQTYFFDIAPEPGINITVVENIIKYMLAPN